MARRTWRFSTRPGGRCGPQLQGWTLATAWSYPRTSCADRLHLKTIRARGTRCIPRAQIGLPCDDRLPHSNQRRSARLDRLGLLLRHGIRWPDALLNRLAKGNTVDDLQEGQRAGFDNI